MFIVYDLHSIRLTVNKRDGLVLVIFTVITLLTTKLASSGQGSYIRHVKLHEPNDVIG